jgi:hypothetical protein
MGSKLLPFILFSALSAILMFRWPGFLFFAWIGASISIENYVSDRYKKQEKQIGRRIAILLMTPVFLLFLGTMQHLTFRDSGSPLTNGINCSSFSRGMGCTMLLPFLWLLSSERSGPSARSPAPSLLS